MPDTTAKEGVSALPDDRREELQRALERYLDATSPEPETANKVAAERDRYRFSDFLTKVNQPLYLRNDKDCISFMVAVTGYSELECAMFEMSEVQPWHDIPVGQAERESKNAKSIHEEH